MLSVYSLKVTVADSCIFKAYYKQKLACTVKKSTTCCVIIDRKLIYALIQPECLDMKLGVFHIGKIQL